MDIVRVGDIVGDRRVAAIDLHGIAFADGSRLELPDGFARRSDPAQTHAVTLSIEDLRRLMTPLTRTAAPSPSPASTGCRVCLMQRLLHRIPRRRHSPTVDRRGLRPGDNPTPDLVDPTAYPTSVSLRARHDPPTVRPAISYNHRFPTPVLATLFVTALCASASAAGTISLDVRDVDVFDAVRLLSTQASTNVVVDGSVPHHPITLRLQNVTFERALAILAQASELETMQIGDVVYLGTGDALNHRYPGRVRAQDVLHVKHAAADDIARRLVDTLPKGTVVDPDVPSASILIGGSTSVRARARALVAALDRSPDVTDAAVPMRFVKASDALRALQAIVTIAPPASAYASDQQNQIVLAGPAEFVTHAMAVLARVDRPGRQVRYDVRVTDIVPTESSNVGVLFGGADVNGQQQAASGSTVTTFLRKSLAINATINALVSKGEAQIIARPSISALNNSRASLLVGQQYPLVYFDARTGTQQVQFVNIGVDLTVTPTIGTDGAITTELETDYSQVTGLVASFPIISTRKAESTLRVRDGETIVIAGLFSDVDSRTVTKVPFLAEIPLIGEIFKDRERNHSRDEVVFLITPHLVVDGDPANAVPANGPEPAH